MRGRLPRRFMGRDHAWGRPPAKAGKSRSPGGLIETREERDQDPRCGRGRVIGM